MNLPILLAVAAVSFLFAGGVPADKGDAFILPGELLKPSDFDNEVEPIDVTFNGSAPELLPSGIVRGTPPLLREIGGRLCGLPYGTIGFKGTCQRLLTRGPCSAGEWLVKLNTSEEGTCTLRPCPQEQLLFKGTCMKVSNRSVCKDGQMMYVDLTGHVHCDCEPDFIYDPWKGQCFTQHDQGSCSFGEYLQMTKSGDVSCVANPCLVEGFAYNNATKKCYRKTYRGICGTSYSVKWHHENMTAMCIASSSHSIFDTPTMKACPPGSVRDMLHNCREDYRVPVETTYPSAYGQCNVGFVKDALGVCRKTHKLFA